MRVYIKKEKFGFSQFNPSNKKIDVIDRQDRCHRPAARHTRGFRRFDSDFAGEYGHLLINKEILSNSPFGRTTQTVVAFQQQEVAAQGAVSPFLDFKKTACQGHTV